MSLRKFEENKRLNKNQTLTPNQFQEKLASDLSIGLLHYSKASVYTVLLDLCNSNGINEVFMILHNISSDFGYRDKLESLFEDAKNYNWDDFIK